MYISASHDYTSRITFPKDGANKFGTNLALANLCFENPLDTANTQHMQHHKQHQHHYDSLTETSKGSIHKPHSRPSK